MASNVVVMTKKGKEVKVVESAFEKVWKSKGWKLKSEASTTPASKPAPVAAKKEDESATDE